MGLTEFLIYVMLPLISFGYIFLKKKYSYFDEHEILHVKPTSWLLGSVSGVGTKMHAIDFFRNIYEEFKGKDVIAGFYTSFAPSINVIDIELAKHILVRDSDNFTNRGGYVHEKNEPITDNLLFISGDKWKFVRNSLNPAFTPMKIKAMLSSMSNQGENFIQAIDRAPKGLSINVRDLTSRLAIDVVASCAFGFEANTLLDETSELIGIFEKILREGAPSVPYLMFLYNFPKVAKFFNLRYFDKTVGDFFENVIGGIIRIRESKTSVHHDFLGMLIQLKNHGSIDNKTFTDSRKFTNDECIAQSFVFFFGAVDNTSLVTSFAFIQLAQHPEIQGKLRREILETIEISNGEINYDNLHEMNYLEQVVNETIRMFQPGFTLLRQAVNDYKVPNSKHVIKKGTRMNIFTDAFHHDDRYWKNPFEFNPDRFTPDEIAKRPNCCYMPFGEGPRNCIGLRFGQVTVKFSIATVLKHFKIKLDTSKTEWPLKLDPKCVMATPIGGFWINFEKILN